MISRREILSLLASIPILLTLSRRSALAQIFFRPDKKRKPIEREDVFSRADRSPIGVATGESVKERVRSALDLIGGIEKLAPAGKKILVKPNVVSGKPHPATTSPEVVEAVVELFYEAGASKVYVGDMSALVTLSTIRNMRSSGIFAAARRAGAECIAFEDYDWVEVELDRARYVESAYVTEWLYKVDLIVNLPVIKTHRSASYSITLKNFIGCTHLKQRPYIIDKDHWEELVAEFNLACRPDLNIVDGTLTMAAGGPWEGPIEATDIIIASGDRVAADSLGLGVIKNFSHPSRVTDRGVWVQTQLKRALELGLGRDASKIELITGLGGKKFERLMKRAASAAALKRVIY